jgi:hypothetical protein
MLKKSILFVKGVHSVVCKNNSSKLCELSLNILDTLINMGIVLTEDIDFKLESIRSNSKHPQSLRTYLNEFEVKYNDNFILAMDLILRNIKWLGCSHCANNTKTLINDQLRGKFKFLMNTLQKKNFKRFKM